MSVHAYRLPADVVPRQYTLALDARLGSDAFGGRVAIEAQIASPCHTITLHGRGLRISEARLVAGEREVRTTVELDAERELVHVHAAEPLPEGAVTLTLSFDGKLSKGLDGLYLAKDGPEQLLCTQCEATDARAIFPCFDEPEFKARFAYQISTSPDAVVLANTPLLSVTQQSGRGDKTWRFATSKPMSTYLVALVIGDVAGTAEETVDGTPMRVWALRGKEQLGAFAHAYTKRLLPWYEAYFGVPYHFDKYDQVATPGFGAGAMENSGLVLFRQNLLLMDPRTGSWKDEKGIALVVAHEFAHMWFGNLVTMRWWDDLWLNEAFAEWIAHKAVHELSPPYMVWDEFQLAKNRALAIDALAATHPIYSPVQTPAEANELFDAITYLKGSAVLRMLEQFLGAEVFRAGLRTYMQEFAERNAAGADLWRHLEQASDVPVTELMESWMLQGGFPLVSVAADEHNNGALRVTQQRHFSDPGAAPDAALWNVPLVLRYADDAGVHQTRFLLTEREASVPLKLSGALRWCYANAGELGFYRQQLAGELLGRLREELDELAPSEQLGLLNDQWALTRGGKQTIGEYLDMQAALAGVEHYVVLREVLGRLHELERLLADAGDERALLGFRRLVAGVFRPKLERLGFEPCEGESQNVAQQRSSVVDAMLNLAQDGATLKQAQRMAEREAADPASIDANLANLLIAGTARFGDGERYQRYLELYQRRRESGASPQETDRYLYSFVEFRPAELVERTLRLLDDRTLPQEAMGPMLRAMLSRRHTQLHAWQYIAEHWDAVVGLGFAMVPSIVEAAGDLPIAKRDELAAFVENQAKGLADQAAGRALERMDQQAEFAARVNDELLGWFRDADV